RGHRVHHAAQALQALTLLQTERIELALLDLDLPAVDGFELAQLIRANGWTLPLVAVTARADAASERRAVAAGMDAYLRKPVDGDTLAATIDALAARRA
ncbi:MAG: response regulator, partial [Lysobacteraceae bacterium]